MQPNSSTGHAQQEHGPQAEPRKLPARAWDRFQVIRSLAFHAPPKASCAHCRHGAGRAARTQRLARARGVLALAWEFCCRWHTGLRGLPNDTHRSGIRHDAKAGLGAEAISAPGRRREHNIHYAKYCIGVSPRSCPPHGNGWASGSALACLLAPPTRMSLQHDRD